MNKRRRKRLISPWHLCLGGAVLLFGLWMVLFSPSVRESIGLSREPVDVKRFVGFLFKGRKPVEPSVISPIMAKDLEEFTQALVDREVMVFELPPEKTEEVVQKENAPQALENELYDRFWAIRVAGTFVDIKTREPQAMIGGTYCSVGDSLFSKKEGRCDYRILGIGRRCVWLLAYDKANGLMEFPQIDNWPDVSFIVCRKEGDVLEPVSVRFACGVEYAANKRFKVTRNDEVEYKIVKLWQRGACFEMRKGESRAYLACMLVANL